MPSQGGGAATEFALPLSFPTLSVIPAEAGIHLL